MVLTLLVLLLFFLFFLLYLYLRFPSSSFPLLFSFFPPLPPPLADPRQPKIEEAFRNSPSIFDSELRQAMELSKLTYAEETGVPPLLPLSSSPNLFSFLFVFHHHQHKTSSHPIRPSLLPCDFRRINISEESTLHNFLRSSNSRWPCAWSFSAFYFPSNSFPHSSFVVRFYRFLL